MGNENTKTTTTEANRPPINKIFWAFVVSVRFSMEKLN